MAHIPRYYKGKLLEYFALGVPAYRLRFQVPLSLPTIERFYRVIRLSIFQSNLEGETLKGIIEMDETMFGGYHKGKPGWGAKGKIIVFGIYKRNGKVKLFPIPNRKAKTLVPLIVSHTSSPGSLYYTDDYRAYTFLDVKGNHVVVEKEKGIPKGRDHINGIEGFWSTAKHFLYHFRGVPKKYFHLYLKEVEFRFNNRNSNLLPILRGYMNQSVKVLEL